MIFVIANQDGYFLGKSGEWLDGRELTALYRTLHKDEAINQLFETNSRDFSLRLSLQEYEPNRKGLPTIPADQLPPALPDTQQELLTDADNSDVEIIEALAS